MKKLPHLLSKAKFAPLLLAWNRQQNQRQMPWKGEKDPYRIWLSEIILQQTRVEQGLAYYNRFLVAFPTIMELAAATDEKVFKLWEGLGYYTRCRNLLATARYIAHEHKGQFPDNYDSILALKGVGPYTAAAIASFAFQLPHAVVDGNVFRVLARVFGIETPTDSTAGKQLFTQLAEELLDKKQPGIYNQAIMDFGATICKPVAPLCVQCVFNMNCQARLHHTIALLPVKEKKTRVRKRWFYFFVIHYRQQVLIHQRKEKDIWQDLFEFPMMETEKEQSASELLTAIKTQGWLGDHDFSMVNVSTLYKQQLSHQLIAGRFLHLRLEKKLAPSILQKEDWMWVDRSDLAHYAFPRFITQYLESSGKQQDLF